MLGKSEENYLGIVHTTLAQACVLVRAIIAVRKHYDQKQAGEESVYSAYTSTALFITEGSQDRNSSRVGTWRQELMQRPWRGLLTSLHPLACSACFLLKPRTVCPGMALPMMGWALLINQ